ncbi:MAG: flagellar basal body P-ring formation chaperone FlgA [Myxococcota bacterium]
MTAALRAGRMLLWLAAWVVVLAAGVAPHARGAEARPAAVEATAFGPTLAPGALAKHIDAFVRARASAAVEAVEIPALDDFGTASASGAPLVVALRTTAPFPLRGWIPITVAISDDTGELQRGVVTARVRERRTLLVAARKLPRGALVTAADVREVPADTAAPGVGTGDVVDASALVGLRTVRAVRAGAAWRSEWVERAPAVRRGEPVRVVFASGALRLELLGKAREDGHPGDRIRVLNPRSRSELVGLVGPDGVVHVGS